jgi:drug/metabolite transporter (DMT)-like permease
VAPRRGALLGLAAAASFGLSAPLSKRLLTDISPQLLAGLLYLGAFVALSAVPRRVRGDESPLRRADLPTLGMVILLGGIVAPVLLLLGLQRTSGTTGSLLLNLEGPLTLVLALLVFGEHLGRRPLLGAVAIFAGALVLSAGGPIGGGSVSGAFCILLACLLWAIDNNLTQRLSIRDPFALVRLKAGIAAATNIGLAVLLFGTDRPATGQLVAALTLGALAYGASVLLDAYALRALGAAREAAVFATAPFIGAVVAVLVLGEHLGAGGVIVALVMALGVLLLLGDRHDHWHDHALIEHDHVHVHDEHHSHGHGGLDGLPHAHAHAHSALTHAHRHVSDAHHRHSH